MPFAAADGRGILVSRRYRAELMIGKQKSIASNLLCSNADSVPPAGSSPGAATTVGAVVADAAVADADVADSIDAVGTVPEETPALRPLSAPAAAVSSPHGAASSPLVAGIPVHAADDAEVDRWLLGLLLTILLLSLLVLVLVLVPPPRPPPPSPPQPPVPPPPPSPWFWPEPERVAEAVSPISADDLKGGWYSSGAAPSPCAATAAAAASTAS